MKKTKNQKFSENKPNECEKTEEEKFEIEIGYNVPTICSVLDLELPVKNRRHIISAHEQGMIILPDEGLDLTKEEDLNCAIIMSLLERGICVEVLKTLHFSGEISLGKLAILMNQPLSEVYEATQFLRNLEFVQLIIEPNKLKLSIKVIPSSEKMKFEIEHPDVLIANQKKWLPELENYEKSFASKIAERMAILEKES